MTETSRFGRIAELNYNPNDREQELVTFCNLCDGRLFCTIAWKDRYNFDTQCNICMDCGLVFLSPRLTRKEYAEFYKNVYRSLVSAYYGRRIDHLTVQEEQTTYADGLIKFLLPRIGSQKIRRLMDIGGSTGVVAQAACDILHCTGVVLDPSPDELSEARAKGLETICTLLEDYNPELYGKSDLVLLCQTVDHLLDVKSSLLRVWDILNDDGVLFIDIVDFRANYRRFWSVEEAIKIDHPYYLTSSTMEAFLTTAGFRVQAMTFAPDHLHIGYLCKKMEPKPISVTMKSDAAKLVWEIREVQAGKRP